ncbi:hypothetical protein [Lysobacter gummosus]
MAGDPSASTGAVGYARGLSVHRRYSGTASSTFITSGRCWLRGRDC